MIKFEHSIFALPFAYLGMILASQGLPPLNLFIAVTFAMISARTFGITMNRMIDLDIDRKNPRTRKRALPQGLLSPRWIRGVIVLSFIIFMASISRLPEICWLLSPLALFAMWVYPYLKKVTWWSHWFLGLILAMAPVGGWLAVQGTFHPIPILLAFGVACWVAGFDILYALQDYHFDRKEKLFSVPVRWGRRNAMKCSGWLHFMTVCAFASVLILSASGIWAWCGFMVIALMILREHRLLVDHGLRKIETAFFTANAWISVVFFAGILADSVI